MTEIVCTLPLPPSSNVLWRNRHGSRKPYLNPKYRAWRHECDAHMLANAPVGGWPRLTGLYSLEITLDRQQWGRRDLGNAEKAISDYLQRIELIEDDRKAERIQIEFGQVSQGCRIRLRAAP